jgi:Domain of unknown function (DUF4158)
MDNRGKRLIILNRDEIEALYGRPRFTQEERGEYFSLSPAEQAALEQLRFINAKIYFILQLGYFKARNMFFVFEPQEAGEDIEFIRERYFPSFRDAAPEITGQEERTSTFAVETAEDATESDDGSAGASVCLSRGGDGDLAGRCDESPYSVSATIEPPPPPTVTPCEQAICDDDTISRNKAIATPDDSPNRGNGNPAGLAGSIASGGKEERAQDDVGSGVNGVNEPADADEGNPQGDGPTVPRGTVPPWAVRRLAELLVPMDPAALALLSDAERRARSWALFHARRR